MVIAIVELIMAIIKVSFITRHIMVVIQLIMTTISLVILKMVVEIFIVINFTIIVGFDIRMDIAWCLVNYTKSYNCFMVNFDSSLIPFVNFILVDYFVLKLVTSITLLVMFKLNYVKKQ